MEQARRRLHFTNLNVWQKASELSSEIGKATKSRPWARYPNLCDQISRSALSVSSNIAEAEGQATNKGSIKFYFIARGSLNEVQSQLQEALYRQCLNKEECDELYKLTEDVARLIAGVLRSRRARNK